MQPFKGFCGLAAKPGVYPRGLQDRAALGCQPAKSRRGIQPADGAACGTAPYDFGKRMEMSFERFDIQVWCKSAQPVEIEGIDQLEEFLFWTVQHYPDVQEFFAVYPGYDPDNRIFK